MSRRRGGGTRYYLDSDRMLEAVGPEYPPEMDDEPDDYSPPARYPGPDPWADFLTPPRGPA